MRYRWSKTPTTWSYFTAHQRGLMESRSSSQFLSRAEFSASEVKIAIYGRSESAVHQVAEEVENLGILDFKDAATKGRRSLPSMAVAPIPRVGGDAF